MPASKALELATIGGARILGLGDEIGTLEVGKKADIAIINYMQPHLTPLTTGKHSNIVALLVFSCSAGDVDTVIIDGKIVMRNRKMESLNEEGLLSKINELAADVLEKAN